MKIKTSALKHPNLGKYFNGDLAKKMHFVELVQ